MKRLVATVVAAGAAMAAVAMPTKAELRKAQEMVTDVTAADVAAVKAKTKTPAEVAAKHMELAGQAGSEAEKYLLLQGAFKLYAKAGDYEGAAKALGTMNREIADMNPEVIVEIYNKAIFSSMKEKAPKLHAIKEAARRQVFYRKQLAKAEAAVKANPKDPAAQKKLGECHAELGNWPKALDAFALAGGNLAKTAAAENDGTAAPQVSGDFWWDYESGDEMSTYKLHAAELYRTALADDSFKGLARTRADQRVKEAEMVESDLPVAVRTVGVGTSPLPKFKAGESFEIVLDSKRKVSLELAACPPGEFEMKGSIHIPRVWSKKDQDRVKEWWGSAHKVQLTYPFLIMKGPLSYAAADVIDEETAKKGRAQFSKGTESIIPDLPVMELAWDDIQVLATRLNKKLKLPSRLKRLEGYEMRLPTEAEWRYAIRAGSDAKDWAAVSDWCKEWGGYWWGRLPKGSYFPFAPLFAKKKSANPWGLFYLGPKTIYADTFDGQDIQYPLHNDMDLCYLRTDVFQYADSETNPVRIHNGESCAYLTFYAGTMPKLSVRSVTKQRCPFRFVFAPKLSLLNVYPREEVTVAGNGSTVALASAPKSVANRTFDLGCERKLEMIACPAGEFTMGEKTVKGDCNEVRKHQVKITRPFWLSKVAVTEAQWRKILYGEVQGGKENLRYDFASQKSSRKRKQQFMDALNKVFSPDRPKGYVFRLPTEAELSYAMTSGGRDRITEKSIGMYGPALADKEKICAELTAKGVTLKNAESVRALKVGMAKPNTWGFYDVINNGEPFVLDRIAPNSKMRKLKLDEKGRLLNISYADVEIDPLCWDEEESAVNLRCDQSVFWERHECGDYGWIETFRVCLGPDLVAEKKAKGK